ncbi:MAG TPA: hypothetical protein V6D30_03415 [Leptolyngbyaceae cyanobacterium]
MAQRVYRSQTKKYRIVPVLRLKPQRDATNYTPLPTGVMANVQQALSD